MSEGCQDPGLTESEIAESEALKRDLARRMNRILYDVNPRAIELLGEFASTNDLGFPVEHKVAFELMAYEAPQIAEAIFRSRLTKNELWLLCRDIYGLWFHRRNRKGFFIRQLSGLYYVNPYDNETPQFARIRFSGYLDRKGRLRQCVRWDNKIPEQIKTEKWP